MVQITCQYTGIVFEAASKRSKNHPDVSDLLNQADKAGLYSTAKDLLVECKKSGFTTIEQVKAHVAAGLKVEAQRRLDAERKAREFKAKMDAERFAATERRAQQNAFLRQHGYVWRKNYDFDFDHYEENRNGEFVWELVAPDGAVVDVKQALDEIERGREVVRAEIAAAKEAEKQAAAAAQARQERLDEIADWIEQTGEAPAGDNIVTGERLHDTFNIYGGGQCFVITPDSIWHLKNNGMDGDDWRYNNVRTGGAGAIGWRIPLDAALAAELREI